MPNYDRLVQIIHQADAKQNNINVSFDKRKTKKWINNLYEILFLTDKKNIKEKLKINFKTLQKILSDPMNNVTGNKNIEKGNADIFFENLKILYNQLVLDAKTILENDPAVSSFEEVYIAYPGFFASYIYRISHQLWNQNVKVLARTISEYGHSKTGIDIHPGAIIGNCFFIDHGTGIVIGETAVIGNNVKIYHGVTLGSLKVAKEEAGQKRHPNIEDNVTIYSGATILGGKTTIGRYSIIGGNVFLTKSVPANSIILNKSEIKIKELVSQLNDEGSESTV
jgi:serine O-acetyltransferase